MNEGRAHLNYTNYCVMKTQQFLCTRLNVRVKVVSCAQNIQREKRLVDTIITIIEKFIVQSTKKEAQLLLDGTVESAKG
ncbi:hypothetical protein Tco_1403805 [Tanacetum coccineum]